MSPPPSDDGPGSRSDPVFAAVVGTYLAFLLGPLALLIVHGTVSGNPAVLYGSFLGLAIACLLAAAGVVRLRPALAVRFGASRLTWVPALLGMGAAVGSLAALRRGGAVAGAGFFLAAVATVLGLLLAVLSRSRYATAVLARESTEAAWTAGWPERDRGRLWLAAAVIGVPSFVGLAVGVAADVDWLWTAGQFGFTVAIVTPTYARERTYHACESGLVVRIPGVARLVPWDAVSAFSRTGEAIVFHRPRRVDMRCAVAEIDDPDDVVAALDRRLPRRD